MGMLQWLPTMPLLASLIIAGCASSQPPLAAPPVAQPALPAAATSSRVPDPDASPAALQAIRGQSSQPAAAASAGERLPPFAEPPPTRTAPEIRTRHALFRPSTFEDLPGWQQDDLQGAWAALRHTCAGLDRRVTWRDICAAASAAEPTAPAMRAFFESRFALLRILQPDATRDGEVTGYFEPLLDGRRQRDSAYRWPVMGVPRDLYTLDWSRVPAEQRRGVVHVKPAGPGTLEPASLGDTQSLALDLRRFALDTRDRRLRVKLLRKDGTLRAEPYPSRSELDAVGLPGGIDAPVLAWVNDPLALYAMQLQGSGRIRMPDGAVLRVAFAEQNGHPFRPLRVVAKVRSETTTRSIGGAPMDEVSAFLLEGDEAMDRRAEATVEAPAPVPDAREARTTRTVVPGRSGSISAAPATRGDAASALVDELLAQASRRGDPPAAAAPPMLPRTSGRDSAAAGASRLPVVPEHAQRRDEVYDRVLAGALRTDPSYVFFKVAADQTPRAGPLGALGVPLTERRSVAIDPRVTPLGYPVFVAAQAQRDASNELRRLVFAQDTGGAIRGALRADYFWGFGAAAGQLARNTRHRGQLWVMLPKAEAQRLASGVATRALSVASRNECLLADGEFCMEVE
jgi:membrane-bound lytic murein transglycosylase A